MIKITPRYIYTLKNTFGIYSFHVLPSIIISKLGSKDFNLEIGWLAFTWSFDIEVTK